MTQDNDYDLKPPEKKPPEPRPGEPGWVPPTPIIEPADPEPEDSSEPAADPDVQHNKAFAILAYILFIIPLVAAPQSRFARFHANQGLILFILWCMALVVIVVPILAWDHLLAHVLQPFWALYAFFGCIFHAVVPLALLIGLATLTLQGIIHAANGECTKLPLIGHWTLLK